MVHFFFITKLIECLVDYGRSHFGHEYGVDTEKKPHAKKATRGRFFFFLKKREKKRENDI